MGSLVLSTRNELLLYHLNPTSDAPLVLKHSSPVQAPCRSLSWRNDGQKFLAVAENTLTVWSKDGACLWELDRTDDDAHLPITSAFFLDKDSIVLASGSTLYRYNASSDEIPTAYSGHPSGSIVTSLALNADETLLASCAGTSLIIHSLPHATLSTLHSRPSKTSYTSLKFSPSRRTFLAAGTASGVVHLFSTTKPSAPLRSISLGGGPLPSPIANVAFQGAAGLLLVACDEKGVIGLLDTKLLKLVTTAEMGVEVGRGRMSLASDGKTLVCGGRGVVRLFDLRTRKNPTELRIGEHWDDVLGVALEPARPRSERPHSPVKSAVASTLLTESVNRLRQSMIEQQRHKPFENDTPTRPSRPTNTTLPFAPGSSNNSISDDLPLSKLAFAESISREARTSTLHTSAPPPSQPSPRSLSHSSLTSPPRGISRFSKSLASSTATSRLRTDSPGPLADPPAPLPFRSRLTSTTSSSSSSSTSSHLPKGAPSSASSSASSGLLNQLPSLTEISDVVGAKDRRKSLEFAERVSPVRARMMSILWREGGGVTEDSVRERRRNSMMGAQGGEEVGRRRNSLGGEMIEGEGARKRGSLEVERTEGGGGGGRAKEGERRRRVEFEDDVDGGRKTPVEEVEVASKRPSSMDLGGERRPTALRTSSRASGIDEGRRAKEDEGPKALTEAMRDVLEEYHNKAGEDIKALHVEMLRQTFAQRTETKALLEEYLGGNLREENARLREENAVLRAENERLRRRN